MTHPNIQQAKAVLDTFDQTTLAAIIIKIDGNGQCTMFRNGNTMELCFMLSVFQSFINEVLAGREQMKPHLVPVPDPV